MTREQLQKRIDTIEESYEFCLAYAAQGVSGDAASKSGGQLREFLSRTDEVLTDLAAGFAAYVDSHNPSGAEQFQAMIDVLERDARDTQAVVRLVMAQPSISSQLIDNLNASIHVRALLTDLFILDESLKG